MDLKQVTLVCYRCNSNFLRSNSHVEFKKIIGNKKSYCSRECYLESHSSRVLKKCHRCSKSYSIPKHRDIKTINLFYCSNECKKNSIKIKCSYCKKEFIKKRSTIKKNNYCSQKCMGKYFSKYNVGENSNSWLGGWIKYYGSNWTIMRNKRRKIDKYKCQICGISENKKSHDVRHIIPFRIFGKVRYLEANNIDNLITLCNICHLKIEPRRKQSNQGELIASPE
jgi:hypothetical protein